MRDIGLLGHRREHSIMPDFDGTIPVYPIRTVARLTGVHSRTIRGWERQNGLLSPARTEGGHRLFSEEDVERIRWIKALLDRGMSLKGIQGVVSVSRSGDGSIPLESKADSPLPVAPRRTRAAVSGSR